MAYTLEAWCDEYETIRHHASRLNTYDDPAIRGVALADFDCAGSEVVQAS